MHAAYGAVLGDWPPRLRSRRDLAEMVLTGSYHSDRVIGMAQSWQAEAVLATALTETWQAFGLADVTALTVWAARYPLTDHDRRLLGLYRRSDPPYSQLALHSLPALSGVRPKVFARRWPADQDFLDRRGLRCRIPVARHPAGVPATGAVRRPEASEVVLVAGLLAVGCYVAAIVAHGAQHVRHLGRVGHRPTPVAGEPSGVGSGGAFCGPALVVHLGL